MATRALPLGILRDFKRINYDPTAVAYPILERQHTTGAHPSRRGKHRRH